MTAVVNSFLRRFRSSSRTGWIGVDVGSSQIKLAQLEQVGMRRRIAECACVPIPTGCAATADSLATGWLSDLLRDALHARPGFRGRAAAAVLSMGTVHYRAMSLPPGTADERREMIAQELAGFHENSNDASEFDWWEAPAGTEAAEAGAVNVVSVPRSVAAAVSRAFAAASLDALVLDGPPFALARAVEFAEPGSTYDAPVAVLDWGDRTAHFTVVAHGQPAFSRVFKNCGAGPLVAAVAEGIGVSVEDAREVARRHGIPNPIEAHYECTEIQEFLADLVNEPLEELSVELDKTLAYLKTQRPRLAPRQLWLTGGGAVIRHAAARLTAETGTSVHVWPAPPGRTTSIDGDLPPRPDLPEDKAAEWFGGRPDLPLALLAQAVALSALGWPS